MAATGTQCQVRKINPPYVLKRESRWVETFCLQRLAASDTGKTLVNDAFLAYQEWLRQRDLGKTSLSVDGFGRLIPKVYLRKTGSNGEGGTCRIIQGMTLIHYA